jgi:flavorubredoxin
VPFERIKVVRDNEELSLGDKTLRFIEAPMLHWPETMFTYLVEDKVLFPCDFFGAHTAYGIFDTDNEELLVHAKRYFGEIMMPFRAMGKKALEKIKDIPIDIIAPSHGCIYKNPSKIISLYQDWNSGITKEKAIVVYVSMWGSTKKMIDRVVNVLLAQGIDTIVYDLSVADAGEIIKDLVDARAIVLGAPTVLGSIHPLGLNAAYLIKLFKPPLQYGMMVSSYGWGPAAVKQASEILAASKIDVVGSIEVNGPPSSNDLSKTEEFALKLAEKIKSINKEK